MAISTNNNNTTNINTTSAACTAARDTVVTGSNSYDEYGNRLYVRDELECFNLLHHPIWVFDSSNKSMWWANHAALEFWNATSLDELLSRNYADDMSDTMKKKNHDNIERLKRNEQWEDVWTLYPQGKPKTVSINHRGIFIRDDGHVCLFCEAFPVVADDYNSADDDSSSTASCTSIPDELQNQNELQQPDTIPEGEEEEEEKDEVPITATTETMEKNDTQSISSSQPLKSITAITTTTTTTTSTSKPAKRTKRKTTSTKGVNPHNTINLLHGEVMLQYLPIAVCQFNINGELKYQNPEALHIFGWPKKGEATNNVGDSSNTTSTATSNQDKDCGGDSLETKPPTHDVGGGSQEITQTSQQQSLDDQTSEATATIEITNDFVNRFVDRNEGTKLYEQIKSGKDVNVEALVHTKRGPGWNAIHARLGRPLEGGGGGNSKANRRKKKKKEKQPRDNRMILFSARDISEIITAKREMQLSLERSEFFAIMAHEIRTPLFQVTGFIDLLDQTNLTNEQKGYVKVLKVSAGGLMAVINDVLDYSKLEAGKMKLDIVAFEPKAVVEGSLAAVAVAAEEKGLMLQSSIPSKGIPVKLMGDPNRLRQILLNLLNNAVKFTHQGSIKASVELLPWSSSSLSSEEEKPDQIRNHQDRILLRFSVEDTGIGIDPKSLSDIFRQYRQAAAAISSAYGGTGLGLSICKSLVACMDGEIGVDSTPGKGSKFWFQIPFPKPKVVDSSASSLSASATTMESKDEATHSLGVLVAEDNSVNQKLISRMLSRLGHKVTVVDNGEQAVSEVQQTRYDLVLMDIQMPVMDGIDATKEIRCLGLTVPIVGLTASVRRDDFESIGFNGWIGKPVRLSELQSKLAEFV